MLHVTHLWQVTNELANPFGQSSYTLDQKLQTQSIFVVLIYKFVFKGCFHQSEANFLINLMALEFRYLLFDKIPTQRRQRYCAKIPIGIPIIT